MGQIFSQQGHHLDSRNTGGTSLPSQVDMKQLTEEFVNNQEKEAQLNKLVNNKLKILEHETQEQLEEQLEASLTLVGPDETPKLTSQDLDVQIIAINEKISKLDKISKDRSKLPIKKKLLKCLEDNSGQSLNCLEIMKEFKEISSQ